MLLNRAGGIRRQTHRYTGNACNRCRKADDRQNTLQAALRRPRGSAPTGRTPQSQTCSITTCRPNSPAGTGWALSRSAAKWFAIALQG
jgi:hypothetical protein